MNIHIIKLTEPKNAYAATDDPSEATLPKSQLICSFDESDPARAYWIADKCLERAKELIAKNGYVLISGGTIQEPVEIGFYPEGSHEKVDSYWSDMVKLGALGRDCSVFRVRFHEATPHRLHRHPGHDELIYVVNGSIRQIIAGQSQTLTAGGVAIIPKDTPHRAEPVLPGTEVIVVLFGGGNAYSSDELE